MTVQHTYSGAGHPVGVVTDAALGAHYVDETAGVPWLCVRGGTAEVDAAWVLAGAAHYRLDVNVPEGGLAIDLAPGIELVNGYLDAEDPQPLRIIVPALYPAAGVTSGRLRVSMEGVSTLGISVPAPEGVTLTHMQATYDGAVYDLNISDGTYFLSLLTPAAAWCVEIEFSLASFFGSGPETVVANIHTASLNGPLNTTAGWVPPAPA